MNILTRSAPMTSAIVARLFEYSPGHPWFYVRGGPVLPISVIVADVRAEGYRGYRSDDFKAIARKPRAKQAAELHRLRSEVLYELDRDVRGYRLCALAHGGMTQDRRKPACVKMCTRQ